MNKSNRLILCAVLLCAVISFQSCGGGSHEIGETLLPNGTGNGGGNGQDKPPPEVTQSALIRRFAFLDDRQIIPAGVVVSGATGRASVVLDKALGQFTGRVEITGMANVVTAVDIHDGDIGNNGNAVVSLVETPVGSGIWTISDASAAFAALTADQIERFKAAGFHVLVRTDANPGGEIRGQLMSYADNIQPLFDTFFCIFCHNPSGQAASTGLILNSGVSYGNLVNQPGSGSTGDIRVLPFDADNSVLYQMISGSGLSVIGRRMPINGPYLPLREENLIKTWINMGAMDDNGATATPVILPPRQFTRNAFLNDKQVAAVPVVVSTATGTASMVLDSDTRLLHGSISLFNMTDAVTSVELRDGDIGTNGNLVVSLVDAGGGVWTVPPAVLTPAQVNRFRAAGFYAIVKTAVNPNGELRGQLMSYADNVQPQFNGYCTICHSPDGIAPSVGLDLRPGFSWGSLVNHPATLTLGGIRVIPFDSAASNLYRRVTGIGFTGVGERMPAAGSFLPPHDENIIKIWIDMGAAND